MQEPQPNMRNHLSEIHNTLAMLFEDGDTLIVSLLFTDREEMAKKAFTSIQAAATFAETQDQDPTVANIYVNLQRLRPGSTTDKRQDVAQYVRFLVDIDRKIKKVGGVRVNASEEERAKLRAVAKEVNAWVSGLLKARPLEADTGNG